MTELKTLPNAINATYTESCERKAKVLDAIYETLQTKEHPFFPHIVSFIETINFAFVKKEEDNL